MCSLVVAVAATLVSVATSRVALDESEHPIAKILTLLDELQDQAKEEGKHEKADYMKYVDWCKESESTVKSAIKAEKAEIAKQDVKISGLKDEIEVLTEDIAYLGKQIEEQEAAAVEAKKIREEQAKLYAESQENADETIDAVADARQAMIDSEKQDGLLQLDQKTKKKVRSAAILMEFKMSPAQHKTVEAFLHSASFLQEGASENPPEKDYEFKSGEVIDMFKDMGQDFKQEKKVGSNEETVLKNNYNREKKAREETIKSAKNAKEDKTTLKGEKESAKAAAEDAKREEETALAADSALLESTQKDCTQMSNEWDERCKIRDDEITAMQMAQKILTKVTGVRTPDDPIAKKELISVHSNVSSRHLVKGISLIQNAAFLRRHDVSGDKKAEAIQLLKAAANRSGAVHVKALNQLASQLMTFDGPFDKLKSMIQKMIFRLMDEQRDEDAHKDWCDLEVERSTASKEDKDDKIEGFTKKLEAMDKAAKKATKKIAENEEKVQTLTEHMARETELRKNNHKDILITIKDSKDAQVALTNAISVLTAFYKESGMIAKEPWEFIQVSASGVKLPDSPKTWDSSYTGVANPKEGGNGVLALLDGVASKFSTMEAEARLQDETDQKAYEKDMAAKKVEIADTESATAMKEEKKTSLQGKIDAMSVQLKATTKENDAVVQYLKDLEPACAPGEGSYEDRKKARSDEIDALRKAQGILEDAFRAK
eukprot:gnl/MRDRNA2_/MRDRNA2_89559_c0_seq1.p1 gnl/MRDRNA2_/MRDRNA2_89559_c0~~gnl/MRDRNA2_/MRDRNA2_89559_c0_seq1.p1  ORF type:complete len:716 (+),score=226.24 gnl/MRDRNA2_/MRDRNA2_89559_c0_seq1:81-2228(+)